MNTSEHWTRDLLDKMEARQRRVGADIRNQIAAATRARDYARAEELEAKLSKTMRDSRNDHVAELEGVLTDLQSRRETAVRRATVEAQKRRAALYDEQRLRLMSDYRRRLQRGGEPELRRIMETRGLTDPERDAITTVLETEGETLLPWSAKRRYDMLRWLDANRSPSFVAYRDAEQTIVAVENDFEAAERAVRLELAGLGVHAHPDASLSIADDPSCPRALRDQLTGGGE